MTSLSHADLAGATSIHNAQNYRPDIDGLRAIAVLAVILYHFKVPFFDGGFVGVDVFFVISGYLITKGILGQQAKGRFDFGDFYNRRVRRLIPALLATIAAAYVASAFLFSPADFKQMSGSTVYALTGISNIFFWMESGYFDTASSVKPLLHTWSLSLEIQFYILWPILLVGISRLTKNVLAATALIFAIGATTAYLFLQENATGAFFLTPFRIHEFLLGAMVVMIERNNISKILKEFGYLIGLILVLAPIFLYSSDKTLFPGLAALVPVTGAALMILTGDVAKSALPCRSWLATKIGEISYSLYLVHWPIFVFASYVLIAGISTITTLALLALTLILAIALYALIEKPLRNKSKSKISGTGFSLATLSCTVAIIVVAASSWGQNGWDWRVPAEIKSITNVDMKELAKYTPQNQRTFSTKTSFDMSSNKEKILVIGDSQASDVTNLLVESGNASSIQIISRMFYTECGAPYVDQEEHDDFFNNANLLTKKKPELIAPCEAMQKSAVNPALLSTADKVYIAFLWRPQTMKYSIKAIEKIRNSTKAKVYVFGRKDLTKSSIDIITSLGRSAGSTSYASKLRSKENDSINEQLSMINGINFIDMMKLTCESPSSCAVLTDHNRPIFFDATHFTKEGAAQLGTKFSAMIN